MQTTIHTLGIKSSIKPFSCTYAFTYIHIQHKNHTPTKYMLTYTYIHTYIHTYAQVTPHGTTFNKDVVITLPISATQKSLSCADLLVYKKPTSDTRTWVELSSPDCRGWPYSVTFTTSTFSLYAIGERPSGFNKAIAYYNNVTDSGNNVGVIVGAVLGSVGGFILLVCCCVGIWYNFFRVQEEDARMESDAHVQGSMFVYKVSTVPWSMYGFIFLCKC
jgi:hypothetical protein